MSLPAEELEMQVIRDKTNNESASETKLKTLVIYKRLK